MIALGSDHAGLPLKKEIMALLLNSGKLLEEKLDIQRNARAKHVDHARRTHAAGQQMERKTAIIIDDGMTGIRAALETNHNVRLGGQHIGDLALALVAPIRANNRTDHGRFNPFQSKSGKSRHDRHAHAPPSADANRL